jgi:hypothetical protein
MGSSPEGTLCVYCRIRTASYIPDGCMGPICLFGPGNCDDRGAAVGRQVLIDEHLNLRGAAWTRLLAVHYEVPVPADSRLRIYGYLWGIY